MRRQWGAGDGTRRAGALLSTGLLLCACAIYQNVGVESAPEGAEVFVDGHLVGTTPVRVAVGRTLDHSVFVKKDGYRPELVVLRRNDPPDRLLFLTPADVRVRLVRLEEGERAVDLEPQDEESEEERRRRRGVQVDVEE